MGGTIRQSDSLPVVFVAAFLDHRLMAVNPAG